MAGRSGISGPRVGALAIALVAALAVAAPAPGHAADQGRITPIVVEEIPQKRVIPVEGTDDRPIFARSRRWTPRQRSLLSLDSGEIVAGEYLHTLNRTSAETTVFEGNEARVLILNLSFPSKRAVPERITHRFEVEGAEPFCGAPRDFAYPAGKLRISREAPPVLSPPLVGEGWLASNAPPGPTSHVNAIVGLDGELQAAERWAADWIQVDPGGRIGAG